MNKKWITFFVALFLMTPLTAQPNEGIRFIETQPFGEVLKRAANENKNIFVDCFATWCGPCKLLAKQTFPQKEVGDYINAQFISIQYDVEKGNGISFYKQYQKHIPGLPTMLIISPKGEVLHAIVGFRDAKSLIDDIKKGLAGKNLAGLEAQYKAGQRDLPFMKDYVEALKGAYKKQDLERVVKDYVANLPVEALLDADIWAMAKDYIKNPYAPDYQFVIKNMLKIKYNMKGSPVLFERQMERGMDNAVNKLLPKLRKKNVQQATLDSVAVLKSLLYRQELQRSPMWLAKFEMADCMRSDQPEKLYQLLNFTNQLRLFTSDRVYLKEAYQYLIDHVSDKKVLTDCLQTLEEMQKSENESSFPVNFYGIIAQTSQKLGMKDKYEDAEKSNQKLEAINNKKIQEFYELFNK